MAPTSTVPTTITQGLRELADRIDAAPSVELGRRYPNVPVTITVSADTIADVVAAATASGTRVFRHGEQTYTEFESDAVVFRFHHTPSQVDRLLHRPVDVTEQLAVVDA